MALDQINTYRSIVGSEMGDPVPVQQLPTTMDDTVPPPMVIRFREGFFKRPLPPVPQFRIDLPAPKPLVKPTPQQSRTPSPAASSVRAGESAAEVSQRLQEQSPSPEADGRQRHEHESRDKSKKMTPKKKAESREASKESGTKWQKLQATAPTKKKGRGRFDDHPRPGEA
ncbi:MAG: hypothetical protein GY835_22890, partial [bacterium]|nr:hypothetical protein [bacterium]